MLNFLLIFYFHFGFCFSLGSKCLLIKFLSRPDYLYESKSKKQSKKNFVADMIIGFNHMLTLSQIKSRKKKKPNQMSKKEEEKKKYRRDNGACMRCFIFLSFNVFISAFCLVMFALYQSCFRFRIK